MKRLDDSLERAKNYWYSRYALRSNDYMKGYEDGWNSALDRAKEISKKQLEEKINK